MRYWILLVALGTACGAMGQTSTDNDLSRLITALLGETPLEEDLAELCDQFGGRVTGSAANAASVEWGLQKFAAAGVTARKEDFEMPMVWIEKATTCTISGAIDFQPKVVALSFSGMNGGKALLREVVDGGAGMTADWERLGATAKDKWVLVETEVLIDIDGLFKEYADGVEIERLAYANGAAGVIYMSSRPKRLLYRHNASRSDSNTMPLLVMAREDAQRCLRQLRLEKTLRASVQISADVRQNFTTQNVIGEIKGSEWPEEIVIIGAHIDSWGLGTGANDNGCNVSLMIDIARQMQRLGIRPKRTIRFALWNGEEQGFFGSYGYCQTHRTELDKHLMALSVDIGSGDIIGFFTGARPEVVAVTEQVLQPVTGLGPFLQIDVPIVGTDNYDFMIEGIPNLVANHKPANYAQNYHAESDTYDKVDLHALKINSAIVAALALGYANLPKKEAAPLHRLDKPGVQQLIDRTDLELQMRMFNVWDPFVAGKRGRK